MLYSKSCLCSNRILKVIQSIYYKSETFDRDFSDLYSKLRSSWHSRCSDQLPIAIVRDVLSKDAISFIKDDLVSKKQKYTEKWMPVNDDLNFYWISDPGKKDSRILKNNVLYSYSAWQESNNEITSLFTSPFFTILRSLSSSNITSPDSFCAPSSGMYDRLIIHEYPNSQGFLTKHQDFNQPYPLQYLFLLSTKGIDYDNGGLFVTDTISNNVFDIDSQMSAGDMVVFPFDFPHEVKKVSGGLGLSRLSATLIRSNHHLDSIKVKTSR